MTDPSPNDLNFGHFGAANYDLDRREWIFSRNAHRKELEPLGSWRTIISASTLHLTPGVLRPARGVQQAARGLVSDYVYLTPALEQIPELEIVSAAAVSATSVYDATIGCQLSFGSIACKGHSDHRSKPIAATTTGEGGNVLQFQILEKERHGWPDRGQDKGVCLEGPSFAGDDRGYWNEDAAPIRQVCFAETEERSNFLAARLPQRTVLFHPTYVHGAKLGKQSKHFELPPSNIDPRPIRSITIKDTGGVPHAHMSFNPEYQRQIAIVDEQGGWSIWDIDDGHRTAKYTVTCSFFGSLASHTGDESTSSEHPSEVTEDGWARIIWCGDANTFIVTNRRRMSIINVKGGLSFLKSPNVIPDRSADWILDVKRHPSNKTHFFVLTTTRLYLVEVTSPSEDPEFERVEPGSAIIMSWTHFRGMEDITLQLHVHKSSADECMMLVHSCLNALIIVYRCEDPGPGHLSRWSSYDPTMLVAEGFDEPTKYLRINQLHLDNLDYKQRESEEPGQGRTYLDSGVRFYQLTAVLSDLSIRQIILSAAPKNGSHNILVEPTSWVRVIKRQRCQWKGLVNTFEADDDFIEPDGMVNAREPHLKRPHQLPRAVKRQALVPARHWFDFSSVYEALHEASAPSSVPETEDLATVDVVTVVDDAEKLLLGDTAMAEPPLGTLYEFAGMRITVSDVDEASANLQNLYPNDDRQFALELRNIASSYVLRLVDSAAVEATTLADLYDSILQNWIAPLSAAIPVAVRQSKERLARRMTAELILACARVRQLEHITGQPDSQPGSSRESGFAPIGTSLTMPSSDPSLIPSSSSLPTFTQSQIEPGSSIVAADPLSRLSQHLRIEGPQTKPIPPGIAQILSHWVPGTDPNTYSWEATEEDLQEDDTDIDDIAQAKKRESARKKKERQERRQKKENEMFMATTLNQPQMLRSSPGPFFGAGAEPATSSQVPEVKHFQSQSQVFGGMGGMGVQSQVEPGRHGGRPILKKKKGKKRVGGF